MSFNPRDYPPNWREISRSIREDRAGGQCECRGECGKHHPAGRCPERDHERAVTFRGRVILTVAHLDHNTHSDDPTNLKAMCQACHLRYDVSHHWAQIRRNKRRALIAAGQQELEL
jgi:hypothetical protein